LGFATGLILSWVDECSWPGCLWHASLAAYLTALLLRWWGGAWRKNLAAAIEEANSQPEIANIPSISKPGKS
jgi:hypothetical protein